LRRTRLEVADAFFHDATDLLSRYTLTRDRFWSIKSRRLKLFVDLRIAYECILKAYVAYFADSKTDRATLTSRIEAFRHSVHRLRVAVLPNLPPGLAQKAATFDAELVQLPVALRYKLDGFDFLEAKEDLYYRTVGNDSWLMSFAECVQALVEDFDRVLQKHAGFVSIDELAESIMTPSHNKYST
jgi:hypothetical protein